MSNKTNLKVTNVENFGIQRKMVSAITTESWETIPHVSYMYEPTVTKFFEEFKKLNMHRTGADKITFNTLMLRVIVEGLKAAPQMNAHIRYNKDYVSGTIETFENINISMTTILPNGEMMTTNLRDFQKRNLDDMTRYIADLRRRAEKSDLNEAMFQVSYNKTINTIKQGKLAQAIRRILGAKIGKCRVKTLSGRAKKEYNAIPVTERLGDRDIEQGTVTVSNIGSLYLQQKGALALLEIIPPQVSAFAVGAVMDKPVVTEKENGEKEVTVGKVLPLCIAFDHRALDFGDIIPFIKRLDEIFENPKVIHQWVDEDKRIPDLHIEKRLNSKREKSERTA